MKSFLTSCYQYPRIGHEIFIIQIMCRKTKPKSTEKERGDGGLIWNQIDPIYI